MWYICTAAPNTSTHEYSSAGGGALASAKLVDDRYHMNLGQWYTLMLQWFMSSSQAAKAAIKPSDVGPQARSRRRVQHGRVPIPINTLTCKRTACSCPATYSLP